MGLTVGRLVGPELVIRRGTWTAIHGFIGGVYSSMADKNQELTVSHRSAVGFTRLLGLTRGA